jgi:hypothetical protein
MNKIQIHEFDPVIYPYKIWIAITDNLNAAVENYANDKTGGDISFEDCERFNAMAFTCYNKQNKDIGVMILFKTKKACSVRTMSHESVHASQFFWDLMGEETKGIEAEAYLVGWIAECCEKVKLNKE